MLQNIILGCIVLILIIFSLYKIIEKKDNESIEDINTKINETINNNEQDTSIESVEANESIEEEYISSYYQNYSKSYNELLNLNNDTIGWLTVNNTKINYPVVQTVDNEYYLNHAYDKSKNIAGWLYVDYRNDMDIINENTIIYGYSGLISGVMFSTLESVLNSTWNNNESNLNINFSIKGKDITWKIFSIYTIKETNDYLYTSFNTKKSFDEFIDKITNRSIKKFDIEVTSEDKILTLSTCYKDNKSRLVVHAKKI